MKHGSRFRILLIALAVVVTVGIAAWAAGGYQLSWWTTDPGGTSTGGDYALSAAIGEPDAGAEMSGGEFAVSGGYLGAGEPEPAAADHALYLPLIVR